MTDHQKRCTQGQHKCTFCDEVFDTHAKLRQHRRTCRSRPSTSRENNDTPSSPSKKRSCIQCRTCGFKCSDRRELVRHQTSQHGGAQNTLQKFNVNLEGDNSSLREEYRNFRSHILAPHRRSRDGTVYNFPTNDLNGGMQEIQNHLNSIYSSENNAFRLNIALGMLLRDVETGETRYFIPYENEMMFDTPQAISNRRDLNRVLNRLRDLDVREYVNNRKPKSSLKPQFVTNLVYYVYKTNFPLGAGSRKVPDFIRKKRCIVTLDSRTSGEAYDDNLCLFRCLVYHRLGKVDEGEVKKFFLDWCASNAFKNSQKTFKGVSFDELPLFEDTFQVNLNMYELAYETGDDVIIPRFLSQENHADTMYVNLYENHTSYISNFQAYSGKSQCPSCFRLFSRLYQLKQHMRICSNIKKCRFPGGFYHSPKTVFEELEDFGIFVPTMLRLYQYFAVFDFEAMLIKIEDVISDKLTFTHKHKPVSVSINSNVPGFTEPIHHVGSDADVLIQNMLNTLNKIAQIAENETREKLSFVFESLAERMVQCAPVSAQTPITSTNTQVQTATTAEATSFPAVGADRSDCVGFDNDCEDNDSCEDETNFPTAHDLEFINDDDDVLSSSETFEYANPYLSHDSVQDDVTTCNKTTQNDSNLLSRPCYEYTSLKRLLKKLTTYCKRLPVLGFNSAKYDLNLIKAGFIKHLNLQKKNGDYVIKRANSYLCIASEQFKFLDVTSYLAAGASYSKFLKAYCVQEEKGFFPYEWFDCEEKLNYPTLPNYEDFYSSLKNHNVLDPDCTGVGAENYEFLTRIWKQSGMRSFADFLRHYNNSDVIGFVKAVENMLEFYFENQIDLFKDTISLPNLARKELFKCSSSVFPLFDFESQDLYRTVQQNIVGGPSIIFKREALANETCIRGNANVVGKRILGHDANGLYAYCIAQSMPTGCFVDRRAETCFVGTFREKYFNMFFWLDYVAERDGIHVRHRLNNGKEVRIGPYRVDGFCAATNTVYEFNGCWHHFCEDCQKPSAKEETLKRQKRARARTEEKREYLQRRHYNLVEMKECVFNENILPHTKHIQARYLPAFFVANRGKLTQSQILTAVNDESLFGMIECDISVPNEWSERCSSSSSGLQNEKLLPHEFFADMAPLFCTSDIPFSHFGEHMQRFVEENDLSKKPRRLLVGGMSAQKILLITPLLKWYMEKGLRISKIYRVVEFVPDRCFQTLTNRVSQARREGDRDPSKAIIADTNKLLICSAYGGLLMNKEKHRSVTYVTSSHQLRLKVNDKRFCHFTEVDDSFYEVEMLKGRITLDLPNYLGFFVLNYAKLHMLRFYYDVLCHYIPRALFEPLEMDTDSLYGFYAEDRLEKLMSKTKRKEFERKLFGYCSNDVLVDASNDFWFPRECCHEHKTFDKRTPGLFKLEASGDHMICLSSKTYMLHDNKSNNNNNNKSEQQQQQEKQMGHTKYSCKGVQKSRIESAVDIYRDVLHTKQPFVVTNIGFRARQSTMQTYKLKKTGFSYFYVKRQVCENGIDTLPLTFTLTPWPINSDYVLVNTRNILSNMFPTNLFYEKKFFHCAHQCFLYAFAIHVSDKDLAQRVLDTPTPFQLLRYANEVGVWTKKLSISRKDLDDIMIKILNLKLEQSVDFLIELLEKQKQGKSRFFILGLDMYWHCGFLERVANVTEPRFYPGCNRLGYLLSEMQMQYANVMQNS